MWHSLLFHFTVYFILITPALSNHFSYVTIFQCCLGRSHKTRLTVPHCQNSSKPNRTIVETGKFDTSNTKWQMQLNCSNSVVFLIFIYFFHFITWPPICLVWYRHFNITSFMSSNISGGCRDHECMVVEITAYHHWSCQLNAGCTRYNIMW